MTTSRMILCLGPHRSGTSACAAGLEALGADLALPGVYANSENARGFFEQPEIVAFDERLLEELAGSWDVPLFDCAGALAQLPRAKVAALEAEAGALIGRLFGQSDLAAMKDPRLCLLLPFWLTVLERAGFGRVDFVHVLRDPAEVAASQRARALGRPDYYEMGRMPGEGAALWLSYSCQMWHGFTAGRHLMISYDRLVDAPVAELRRLADGLELKAGAEALRRYARDFVDPGLRHGRADAALRAAIAADLPQAGKAFALMQTLADGRLLEEGDVAPLAGLWADAGTQAAVGRIMVPATGRLARQSRVAGLAAADARGRQAEAERAETALRVEVDRSIAELKAEIARVAAAGEAERLVTAKAFDTEMDAQSRAAEAERARLVAEFQTQLEAQAGDFRADRAGALADQAAEFAAERAGLVQAGEERVDALERDLGAASMQLAGKTAEVDAVYASTSWRVSAPVRAMGRLARRVKHRTIAGWIGLNHAGRRSYGALAGRSPWLAVALRRLLSPVIHLGNRLILKRDFVPSMESLAAQSAGIAPDRGSYQSPGMLDATQPLVSVVVPNFNHAPYLRQRLDSIFAQSYANYEVILMDDGSTDGSRAILQEYADRYPGRTRLMVNAANSGGPFFQWESGIRAARGDLIWIAESDDWCTENFLATLVPFFANPAVAMAYAPTLFMSEDGGAQLWSLWEYLADLGPDRWRAPFVLPAPAIVREAFALRNIIPNVSSALFRRPDPERLAALESPIWRGMRTCGDWVFYLNLIRGGLLAYSPAATSYFRQHPANASVGSFTGDAYYAEHETVAKCVQRHYRVEPEVFARQRRDLVSHWTRFRGGFDRAAFDACYSLAAIAAEAAHRKPNLLMAGFAFSAGGGEMLPIVLANLMKTTGYAVTFLDCHQEPQEPELRCQLAADIPVVTNIEDLNGIVRDFDIEVIHSHHAWVDSTVLDLLPETSPVRTVITLHGMYETIPGPLLRLMLPRLARRTARMVYVAEKNIRAVESLGGLAKSQMRRIANALPHGVGRPVPRADLGIPEDAFVLALVSRGIAEKGWEEAIRAVTRAREIAGREIHLVIIGNGPEYERLAPDAPDFVHFEGFRGNTRDYFAMADMGFLPSRFRGESFPLVAIDCLIAGRPVLASELGELRAMLGTGSGLAGDLFALRNWQVPVEDLAARIAALACAPEAVAAMAVRAPEAAAKFDPVAMRDAYDAAYRGCMPALREVA